MAWIGDAAAPGGLMAERCDGRLAAAEPACIRYVSYWLADALTLAVVVLVDSGPLLERPPINRISRRRVATAGGHDMGEIGRRRSGGLRYHQVLMTGLPTYLQTQPA